MSVPARGPFSWQFAREPAPEARARGPRGLAAGPGRAVTPGVGSALGPRQSLWAAQSVRDAAPGAGLGGLPPAPVVGLYAQEGPIKRDYRRRCQVYSQPMPAISCGLARGRTQATILEARPQKHVPRLLSLYAGPLPRAHHPFESAESSAATRTTATLVAPNPCSAASAAVRSGLVHGGRALLARA
jgi:hypothetical protein